MINVYDLVVISGLYKSVTYIDAFISPEHVTIENVAISTISDGYHIFPPHWARPKERNSSSEVCMTTEKLNMTVGVSNLDTQSSSSYLTSAALNASSGSLPRSSG
jgi:hypothetical protein